jgi:hypothetical protein
MQPSPEFVANTNSQKYNPEALRFELLFAAAEVPPDSIDIKPPPG